MLSKIAGVRVMSEPWSLLDLHLLYKRKEISMAQHKDLLKAALRLQLKPDSSGRVTHMVLKLTPHCIAQCGMMKEILPRANLYFQTRNLESTMRVCHEHLLC